MSEPKLSITAGVVIDGSPSSFMTVADASIRDILTASLARYGSAMISVVSVVEVYLDDVRQNYSVPRQPDAHNKIC